MVDVKGLKIISRKAPGVDDDDKEATPIIHKFGSKRSLAVTSSRTGISGWMARDKTINAAPYSPILTKQGHRDLVKKLSNSPKLDWKALVENQGLRGRDVIANAQAYIYENKVTEIPWKVLEALTFSEIFPPVNQSREGVYWGQEIERSLIAAVLKSNPENINQNLIDLCDYLSRKKITDLPSELKEALSERENLKINPEFCLRANIKAISADDLKQIGVKGFQEIARAITEDNFVGSDSLEASIENLSQEDKYEFLSSLFGDPTNIKTIYVSGVLGTSILAEPALELLWRSFTSKGPGENPQLAELSEKILRLGSPHSGLLEPVDPIL